MLLVSFSFLFATAGATADASTADEHGLFTDLAVKCAVYDALLEGALALLVFGIASAIIRTYRRRNAKAPRAHKSKSMSSPSITSKTPSCDPQLRLCGPSIQHAAHAKMASQPPKSTAPTSSAAAFTTTMLTRETDALAGAVKAGNARELPRLLDAAFARILASAGKQNVHMVEKDVGCALLHSALRACASAHRFTEAISAYDHFAGLIGEGKAGLWSVLLYCITEAGAFGRCSAAFEPLCMQGTISAHDFVNMVRCYAGSRNPEGLRAMISASEASQTSIDIFTWNRALAACNSLELAEELAASNVCPEGLDAVGFNTLMKYNARAGHLSRCFELQSVMMEKGLEASEVTFGILLDACVGAKEFQRAKKVFEELCSSGLRLNVVHCTSFMKSLLNAGKLDEAGEVLKEMARSPDAKPDLITYSIIVKAYSEKGDVSSAIAMLETMRERGLKPDEIIFNNALTGCCTFPLKATNVLGAFDRLCALGMRPTTTTLSILLKCLALTESWSISLQVLKDAYKRFGLKPELRLYAQLAQACVKARDVNIVIDIFNETMQTAQLRSERVDPVIAGRFIRSCLLGGAVDKAAELQELARRRGVTIEPSAEKMLKTALAKQSC